MMNEEPRMRYEPFEEFYIIGEQIGSGQFATVKKCTEKSSGAEFAAKFLKKKRTRAGRRGVSAEQISRETGVLCKVRHDGIIYLHEVFEAKQEYILVMELLSGGELFEFLAERDYITESEAAQFARQVIEAIAFLHENRIVHLDIKPENIVLKKKGESLVKLIDFGLAREIKLGETVKEIMGTPEFVAPEIINFESISLPTDMWSIGVLTYILLSGASPFLGDDNNETFSNILNVDYEFEDEYFSGISEAAKDFVSGLLVRNPKNRMTAKTCLENVWLQSQVKRKATIIKTTSFIEFTARARWKKSLQKVMAVNRIKLIGKKSEGKNKEGGVVLQVCTEILDENKNETIDEVTEDMETYVVESAAEVLEGDEACGRCVRVKSVKRHEKKPMVVNDNTAGINQILTYEDEEDNPWRRRSVLSAQEQRKLGFFGVSNGRLTPEDDLAITLLEEKEEDLEPKEESFVLKNERQSKFDEGGETMCVSPSFIELDVNENVMAMRYKDIIDLLEEDVIRPFELGHGSLTYEICKTLQTIPDNQQFKETSV